MLMRGEKKEGILAYPVDTWYTFRPHRDGVQHLSTEEAEQLIKKRIQFYSLNDEVSRPKKGGRGMLTWFDDVEC